MLKTGNAIANYLWLFESVVIAEMLKTIDEKILRTFGFESVVIAEMLKTI